MSEHFRVVHFRGTEKTYKCDAPIRKDFKPTRHLTNDSSKVTCRLCLVLLLPPGKPMPARNKTLSSEELAAAVEKEGQRRTASYRAWPKGGWVRVQREAGQPFVCLTKPQAEKLLVDLKTGRDRHPSAYKEV